MDAPLRRLRQLLFGFYLDQCRPPTVAELASGSGHSVSETKELLKQLENSHHIVLYDEELCTLTPIAMAHPFSHLS
ncbi:hypothetical protein LOZ61_006116 [Ophidiomyces ophidiicola]|nr:hypothetical protein LOZ61_006116 [Ophidiomyces ophidiicola]KAI2378015.1 hypothetical protein LOY89_002059 [Ophidiomyces ophidiicola]